MGVSSFGGFSGQAKKTFRDFWFLITMRKRYSVEPIIANMERASRVCSISRIRQQSLGKEGSGVDN